MFDLSGKVALVTGAGRGVGAEIAAVLARANAAVVVNDLFAERAEAAAGRVRQEGARALAVAADVGERGDVDAMVRAVAETFGSLDLLVNNAGVPAAGLRPTPFVDSSRAEWDDCLSVNVLGAMNCSQAALPVMLERGRGRIVSVASDAGRVGEPGLVAYSAAKAAVMGFSRALAKEVGPAGVTCNCVSVGRVEGTASSSASPLPDAVLRRYPAGRIGRPQDVAAAVLWLVSDEAAWVTGQTIGVDGGYVTT
jgi:NAD(P)-dependent dehydrogenase (short-subunit alcohol dehydrogenase family)